MKLVGPNAMFPPPYWPPQLEYGFASARQPHCPNGNEGGCMAAKGEERSIPSVLAYVVNVLSVVHVFGEQLVMGLRWMGPIDDCSTAITRSVLG